MAKINQQLIQRIADNLGITPKAVYPRIHQVVVETGLERDLAAMLLARRNGININRYSTAQQRSELRAPASTTVAATHVPASAETRRAARQGAAKRPKKVKGNSVFVVHGRDEALRRSLFAFLRALDLNPMEWEQAIAEAKGANPYIGDVLNAAMAKVQVVVVLFSPDELAHLKQHLCGDDDERKTEGKLQGQARPNVLFEAGLALGAHAEKTLIVQVGKVRPFSDIAGKHLLRLSNDFSKRNALATRLKKLGCVVNTTGDLWTEEGDFTPTEPKPKAKKKKAAKSAN